jgi:hypothetical protein
MEKGKPCEPCQFGDGAPGTSDSLFHTAITVGIRRLAPR